MSSIKSWVVENEGGFMWRYLIQCFMNSCNPADLQVTTLQEQSDAKYLPGMVSRAPDFENLTIKVK